MRDVLTTASVLYGLAAALFWPLAVVGASQQAFDTTPLELTPQEKQWIETHATIRLAPDPAFPPIEYIDDSGRYRGIAADYVALLEQKLGIRFSIVPLQDWDAVLEHAAQHRVDVLGAASASPEREQALTFTDPYLELPGVLIVNTDVAGPLGLDDLQGKRLAVVSGYVWQDHLDKEFPEIILEPVEDVATGLRKVSFGSVDAMIANLAVATFFAQKEGLSNLRVAGDSGYYARYALAVRNDWPILANVLDKGLAQISPEERATIANKWFRPLSLDSQTDSPEKEPQPPDPPSLTGLEAKIEALENDTTMVPAIRDKLLELYRLASSRLESTKEFTTLAARHTQTAASAPGETELIRKKLAKSLAQGAQASVSVVPEHVTRKQLESRLRQEQANLNGIQDQFARLNAELRAQRGRPAAARKQLAEAKLQLDRIEWELAAPPPPGQEPALSEAARTSMLAGKRMHLAEIDMLEHELLGYDARLALLIARHNQTEYRQFQAEEKIKQFRNMINALLGAEAAEAQEQAQEEVSEALGKHPVLLEAAEENARLGEQLSGLAKDIQEKTERLEHIGAQLTELDQDLNSVKQQLEIAGHSAVLGEVLIATRRKLPSLKLYQHSARDRRQEIAEARLNQFRIDEQMKRTGRPARNIERLVGERVRGDLPERQREEIQSKLEQLMSDRDELLGKLVEAYRQHAKQLQALDLEEKQLIDLAQELKALLDKRLLWTPSTSVVGPHWLDELDKGLRWFGSAEGWSGVRRDLHQGLAASPLLGTVTLLGFVVLVSGRGRLRRMMEVASAHVGNPYHDNFWSTLQVLMLIVLLAAPWPILLGLVAWVLMRPVDSPAFTSAVAHGLAALALTVFVLESFREVFRKKGLAEIHFQWSAHAREALWRNFGWIRLVFYPSSFLLGMAELHPAELHADAPGRLAFLAKAVALSAFAWRVTHPGHGAIAPFLQRNRNGALWRLRHGWYPLLVGAPLALLGLALYGYHYTAVEILERLGDSARTIFAAIVCYYLLLRWVTLAEQKLALRRTLEERRAAHAARAAQKSGDSSGEGVPDDLQMPEISMGQISEQTRALVQLVVATVVVIGFGVAWADITPALDLLDDVAIWQRAAVIEGVERMVPVTLKDLGVSTLVLALTVIAAKNLPGLLEITVLRRLSLDKGNRYAITTVSRYSIVAVGLISAFQLLGFGWSKVQWLVAALGVGLGFGLQEIFANFISGLILLFERPIRVGDIVTVGNTTGTVSRIQIRATTITDWDRKELVIPNKSFVTGDLINWTLSDPITRLIVRVGVAYGSDTELTQRLMLEVAKRNRLVLDDPPPTVFFCGFGESSLSFEMRVFYKDVLQMMPLTHELHVAIDTAFRRYGIEIAFPQRDIRVRSLDSTISAEDVVSPVKTQRRS